MIYVSGRIFLEELNRYEAQFWSAKEYLIHEVWAYEDNSVKTLFEMYKECEKVKPLSDLSTIEEVEMRIQMAKSCTRLYLVQGWEVDDLCRMEHTIAKAYGIPVTYSRKF